MREERRFSKKAETEDQPQEWGSEKNSQKPGHFPCHLKVLMWSCTQLQDACTFLCMVWMGALAWTVVSGVHPSIDAVLNIRKVEVRRHSKWENAESTCTLKHVHPNTAFRFPQNVEWLFTELQRAWDVI